MRKIPAFKHEGTPMTRWIEALGQDFRYAVRRLRKSPGFILIAVLTLAIGIGATTAVFIVINGVLLRPLPYPDADRLISVSNVDRKDPKWSQEVSETDVAHWRSDNGVFEYLCRRSCCACCKSARWKG